MKKSYIAIIIVIIVLVCVASGILIYKNINKEYDEIWIDESGDEDYEEYIFNDVPKDYWASDHILFIVQKDIMSVDEENNFKPEENMTIKDFLLTLLKALMPRVNASQLSNGELVKFLQEKKILNDDFEAEKLDSSLTNYDVAIFIAKADIHIRDNDQEMADLKYSDLIDFGEVERTLIGHVIARGFVKTKNSKSFYPQKVLTRAEVAEILYLFLNG